MPKKLTTEEFVLRARAIHGDYYDYGLSVYDGKSSPLTIVCPVHGPFSQTPASHLHERHACRNCTMTKNHGSVHPSQRDEVREKRKRTLLERYGTDHPMRAAATTEKARVKRARTFVERFGGHPMSNPVIAAKASKTWRNKSSSEIAQTMAKKKATFRERYGYENPFDDAETKRKIKESRTALGQWAPDSALTEWRLFRREVWRETERTYRENKDKLDPERLRGSDYHLDHRVSILDGFLQGATARVIAHPANLEIVDRHTNLSKGRKSSISLIDLLKNITPD